MKKRLWYLTAFVILLMVEICIALFVHDRFIRPYVGDVLVTVLLYEVFSMKLIVLTNPNNTR